MKRRLPRKIKKQWKKDLIRWTYWKYPELYKKMLERPNYRYLMTLLVGGGVEMRKETEL